MKVNNMGSEVLAVKDEENEFLVSTVWRPIFEEIVKSFVKGDYHISAGIPGVSPISDETAAQIKAYVQDYGETLIELPEETWESSVCIWMGSQWDVLIDLWAASEGRSDLVLSAQVFESERGYTFNVYMVYVP